MQAGRQGDGGTADQGGRGHRLDSVELGKPYQRRLVSSGKGWSGGGLATEDTGRSGRGRTQQGCLVRGLRHYEIVVGTLCAPDDGLLSMVIKLLLWY
jgi:hypothetical protein